MYDDHHGFPTGLGQIIVKNEEEAWRTYRAWLFIHSLILDSEAERLT